VPNPINMPPGCAFHPRCDQVKDVCHKKVPELKEVEKGRQVRCWLFTDREEVEE